MTNQDWPEFMKLCALLSQAFDKPVGTALMKIYFEGLKDFDLGSVSAAVSQAVKTKTFMPKVAELRQLIEGSVEDRAAQAWAGFLDAAADGGTSSVKFADPATAWAMDAVFGGWIQACRLLSAGGTDTRGNQVGGCTDEMLASYQKQFARQYVAALNSPREVEAYRPGMSEMSMREGGGAWSARMPTLQQPVIYVGAGKAVTLRLKFDVAQGRLTDDSRALLEKGWDEVRALAAAETRELKATERKALPPAPTGEMATPEEVGQITRFVQSFAPSSRKQQPEPAEVIDIADWQEVGK